MYKGETLQKFIENQNITFKDFLKFNIKKLKVPPNECIIHILPIVLNIKLKIFQINSNSSVNLKRI